MAARELYARLIDGMVAVVLESASFELAGLFRRRGLEPPPSYTEDELAMFEPGTQLAGRCRCSSSTAGSSGRGRRASTPAWRNSLFAQLPAGSLLPPSGSLTRPAVPAYPRGMVACPFTRATAALAAFVLVVGGLLASRHSAAVRHAVCAEHGEEVHLPSAAPAFEHDDTAAARLKKSPGPQQAEDHHHCQILAVARQPVVSPEAAVAAAPIVDAHDAPAPPAARSFAADAQRYRLAPKTSPPV